MKTVLVFLLLSFGISAQAKVSAGDLAGDYTIKLARESSMDITNHVSLAADGSITLLEEACQSGVCEKYECEGQFTISERKQNISVNSEMVCEGSEAYQQTVVVGLANLDLLEMGESIEVSVMSSLYGRQYIPMILQRVQ